MTLEKFGQISWREKTELKLERIEEKTVQKDNTRFEMGKKPEMQKTPSVNPDILAKWNFSRSSKNGIDIKLYDSISKGLVHYAPWAAFALHSYSKSYNDIENLLDTNYGWSIPDEEPDWNSWELDQNMSKKLMQMRALKNNPTFCNFLTNLVNEHSSLKAIATRERKKDMIQWKIWNKETLSGERGNGDHIEDEWIETIPLLEEYILEHDTNEEYSEFLTSTQCFDKVFLPFFEEHGVANLSSLEWYIRRAWNGKLQSDYYAKYKIVSKEDLSEMDNFWQFIWKSISGAIKNHIKNWWNREWKWLPDALNFVMNEIIKNEKIRKRMWDKAFKLHFDDLLKNAIIGFVWNNVDENDVLKHTENLSYDLELRSYLYLFWKYFYPDDFKSKWWSLSSYESDLEEILTAILYYEWNIDKVRENKYLRAEEARTKEKEIAQKQAREEAFRRNQERNGRMRGWSTGVDTRSLTENWGNIDLNNASWSQIAQWREIWKQITQFDKTMDSKVPEADKVFLNMSAFNETVRVSFQKNDLLKSYITTRDLRSFFNVTKDWITFNNDNRYRFKNEWIKEKGIMDAENLDKIENLLKIWFISEYNDSLKNLTISCRDKMGDVHNVVKDHAIGAVIDNIKDIFDELVRNNTSWEYFEWFKYDKSEPVKMNGDEMIISGSFRWKPLNISYDVKTGELKMSEYIHIWEKNSFIIWSSAPTLKIWNIDSFDKILNSFYNHPSSSLSEWISERFGRQRPQFEQRKLDWNNNKLSWKTDNESASTQRPRPSWRRRESIRQMKDQSDSLRLQQICWTKIDEIWWKIREELEKHTTENSILSDMLKTFGISKKYETVKFVDGSDLHTFTQIIKNSDQQTLNEFLNNMPQFMNLLWLKWWEETDQIKDKEKSDSIWSIPEDNDGWSEEFNIVHYLQRHSTNFNQEKKAVSSAQFGSPSNFWILEVFNKKFSSEDNTNWKLNSLKIREFMSQIWDTLDIERLGISEDV